MNRKRQIVRILIIAVCVLFCISNIALALTGSELTQKFNGENGVDVSQGEGLVRDVVDIVLSVVRIVAIGIAVIMITLLGIKYIAAAPSEKANIKNQLITFTVGAVVVIGTTSILTMIKNAVDEITKI